MLGNTGGFLRNLFSTEHDVGSKEAAMKRIQEAQQRRGGKIRTGKPDPEQTESREPSAIDEFYDTMRDGIIGVQEGFSNLFSSDENEVGSAESNLARIQEAQKARNFEIRTGKRPASEIIAEELRSENNPIQTSEFASRREAHRKRLAARANGLSDKDFDLISKQKDARKLMQDRINYSKDPNRSGSAYLEATANLPSKEDHLLEGSFTDDYLDPLHPQFHELEAERSGSDVVSPSQEVTPFHELEAGGSIGANADPRVTQQKTQESAPETTPQAIAQDKSVQFSAQSEDEAKGDASARGVREEGFLPKPSGPVDDYIAGKEAEQENIVKEEQKQLSDQIQHGTPEEKAEGKKIRKKIYEHLPPRERALAKEETGNYWVDPISGVAINIDAIEADGQRKSNWLMIDKLPEHARPYFMAKFGYLDEEDVDGMPIDPKIRVEEMKMQTKKLEFESLEKRHGQTITSNEHIHGLNMKWNKEQYNGLSRAQQEELQIKQYNQVRSNVDMLMKNGQYESAMLLGQQLGLPYIRDVQGFWRSKAKASSNGIDPTFNAAFNMSTTGLQGMTIKDAGKGYYAAIGDYWKKLVDPNLDPDLKTSYFEAKAKEHGLKLWDQLSDEERKGSNPMLHNNSIRTELLKDLMLADPKYGNLHQNLNYTRTQVALSGSSGSGSGSGKNNNASGKKVPKVKEKETSTKLTEKSEKFVDKAPTSLKEKIFNENLNRDGTPKQNALSKIFFDVPEDYDADSYKKRLLKEHLSDGEKEFKQKLLIGKSQVRGRKKGKFKSISEARKHYEANPQELEKESLALRYYIQSGK